MPAVPNPAPDLLRGLDVARLGGADEIVIRDVQRLEQVAVLRSGEVCERWSVDARLLRRPFHFLTVLVGAGQEKNVLPHQPARARDRVRNHGRVGMTEMGLGVDVVDRSRDVEAGHIYWAP